MDDIYHAVPSRTAFAAVVRRSRVPEQEAGRPRDDVGRHQLARPPAESVVGAEPALPRLHAVQPDRGHQGTDCLLPGLPHLHHRRGRSQRPRSPLHRTGRAVRQAAIAGLDVAGVRLHPARPAQAGAGRQPGRARGARAVHREVPADHQPGRRQGHRGHGVLRLQPAGLAERSRRRPDAVRAQPERRARLDVRTAAAVACGAVDHVDARHQARRGRARALERPLGTARGVESRRHAVARAQSPLPGRHRRR